jgi:hypothetical protein
MIQQFLILYPFSISFYRYEVRNWARSELFFIWMTFLHFNFEKRIHIEVKILWSYRSLNCYYSEDFLCILILLVWISVQNLAISIGKQFLSQSLSTNRGTQGNLRTFIRDASKWKFYQNGLFIANALRLTHI